MHIIYRLEHKERRLGPWGMYREYGFNLDEFDAISKLRHTDYIKYPPRRKDVPYKCDIELKKLICGCPSYRLLLSWFNPKEIKYLLDEGFIIRRIEVSSMIMGVSERQCFFTEENIIRYLN